MLPRLEAADLLGARGLALAGGVVTLLGVVFFFALAASNGWIGPVERVLLGAIASALLFAAGVFAHARYGRLYASVAAAGAGIAGGYATLLFAAARYELMPPLVRSALAAAIAAVAVALSLNWSSEIVAGFGLIGAMSCPSSPCSTIASTATGTGFVALVFLGAAIVGDPPALDGLLLAAGAVSVPQLLSLVLPEGRAGTSQRPGRRGRLRSAVPRHRDREAAARGRTAARRHRQRLRRRQRGADVVLQLRPPRRRRAWNRPCRRGRRLRRRRGCRLAARGRALGARHRRRLCAGCRRARTVLRRAGARRRVGGRDGHARVARPAPCRYALPAARARLSDPRDSRTRSSSRPSPTCSSRGSATHLAGVPALLAVAAGAAATGCSPARGRRHAASTTMPTFVRELVEDLHAQRRVLSLGSLASPVSSRSTPRRSRCSSSSTG